MPGPIKAPTLFDDVIDIINEMKDTDDSFENNDNLKIHSTEND